MGLLDGLQSASNAAASNVSGPVDALAWLLRKAGVPVPEDAVGSSAWMERKGLTKPVKQSASSLAGETAGLLAPIAAVAKAPQIAKGLLQMGENAAAPATLNKQRGIFMGDLSKTWDKAAADKAVQMEKAGKDPRAIWQETGTFKGPDGKWRQEIDDSAATFNNPHRKATSEEVRLALEAQDTIRRIDADRAAARNVPGFNLAEFYKQRPGDYEKWVAARKTVGDYEQKFHFDYQGAKTGSASDFMSHPDLYGAYPDVSSIATTYNPRHSGGNLNEKFGGMLVGGGNEKSIALHELQHAVQGRQGFGKGGSPDGMRDEAIRMLRRDVASGEIQSTNQAMSMLPMYQQNAYQRLAGEAEARAVQSRMNLTAEERRALFPLDSYDVPLDKLIVR
jgi:hypothetical protein